MSGKFEHLTEQVRDRLIKMECPQVDYLKKNQLNTILFPKQNQKENEGKITSARLSLISWLLSHIIENVKSTSIKYFEDCCVDGKLMMSTACIYMTSLGVARNNLDGENLIRSKNLTIEDNYEFWTVLMDYKESKLLCEEKVEDQTYPLNKAVVVNKQKLTFDLVSEGFFLEKKILFEGSNILDNKNELEKAERQQRITNSQLSKNENIDEKIEQMIGEMRRVGRELALEHEKEKENCANYRESELASYKLNDLDVEEVVKNINTLLENFDNSLEMFNGQSGRAVEFNPASDVRYSHKEVEKDLGSGFRRFF